MHTPEPTPDEKSAEDLAFLGKVLSQGRSVILVRTESQEIATAAAEILDRMGISAQWCLSLKMQTASRRIGEVSVVDLRGRITVGEGNIMLRRVVAGLLEKGSKRILLNLAGVGYIDSSGLGELVRTYTTLQKQGGQLKMVNLNQRLADLFKVTGLQKVFDIYEDEGLAIQAFGPLASAVGA